jgi:SAM-dependent methyltransferase
MRSGTFYRSALFSQIGVRNEGERALDVGAFDGYWIADQPGSTRIALDVDVQANTRCQVFRGDGLRLPFIDGSFDSVFAFDVIEHVADDDAFLRELLRVTRPGGRVTMTTPNANLRIFPSALTPWVHRKWGHDRCTGYSPVRLRAMLLAAGASSVTIQELRSWAFLTWYLPLSILARLSKRAACMVLSIAAHLDSRWKREGDRGYLLAEVIR